jgi:hypothetical protein
MAQTICPSKHPGDWWIEYDCADDGDRFLKERFADGVKTVAFVRQGWFGMPRDARIAPKQAIALARGTGRGRN